MPKYAKSKRTSFRKKRSSVAWYNRKFTAFDVASKALRAAKYVKSLINVEKKFLDTVQANTSVSSTAGVNQLSAISQGTDYNQRDGLSVKAASIQGRIQVTANSTSTVGHQLRYILVRDMNDDGTAPVISDLLESATNVNSPLNHTFGDRFKVLYDKSFNTSQTGPEIQVKDFYIPLNDHIKWSDATTGRRVGHIWCFYLSDTAVAGESPTFNAYWRLRFIDN